MRALAFLAALLFSTECSAFTHGLGTCLLDGRGGAPAAAIQYPYMLSQPVSGAADNGSGKVRLTVADTSLIGSGATRVVSGVAGTTEANGNQVLTIVDATHVDLGSVGFVHAYGGGGTLAYLARSPCWVHGVDGAVGIPTAKQATLQSFNSITLPGGCQRQFSNTTLRCDDTDNLVFENIDFSVNGGVNVSLVNCKNASITNSYFAGANYYFNNFAIVGVSGGGAGLVFRYNTVDVGASVINQVNYFNTILSVGSGSIATPVVVEYNWLKNSWAQALSFGGVAVTYRFNLVDNFKIGYGTAGTITGVANSPVGGFTRITYTDVGTPTLGSSRSVLVQNVVGVAGINGGPYTTTPIGSGVLDIPGTFSGSYVSGGAMGWDIQHENFMQWDGGSGTVANWSYNTTVQLLANGAEGPQFYFNAGGTIASIIHQGNTMIVPKGNMSYMVHGSSHSGTCPDGTTSITGAAVSLQNYFDPTGAFGPYYPGSFCQWSAVGSGGNVNMVTGAGIAFP